MKESQHKDKPAGTPGAGKAPDARAAHGYRNEVSWDAGEGRQPYANQGEEEQGPVTAGGYQGGNRGALSGRNLEQLEEAKRKPGPTDNAVARRT